MKSLLTILIIVCLVLFKIVNTDIPEDIYQKYNHSYNQWQIVKRQWNNSYQYTIGTSSWTGHRTTTTVFIQNGEIVGREYTHSYYGEQREHWFENKDQLYSHGKNIDGREIGTIDHIYSKCLQSLDVITTIKHILVFEVDTNNHGLLKSCGNIPDGCADDCFFGVSINNLKSYDQHQSRSNAISTTSTINNKIDRKFEKIVENNGNPIMRSNFLLFLNLFIVKAIVCAYSY